MKKIPQRTCIGCKEKKDKKDLFYIVVLILTFVAVTLLSDGYEFADGSSEIYVRPYKYFFNLVEMPWVAVLFLAGVASVLYAIIRAAFATKWRLGIWFSGIGTVLVVLSLFFLAGYNNTPYYPSATDMQSSLTIYNSSSSLFTLEVMSVVSLLLPFVLGYIFYAWRAMDRAPITELEMESGEHKY